MTTSRPFLTRFALPTIERNQDEPGQVVRSEDPTVDVPAGRGESGFTRVRNETTDEE